MYVPHFNAMPDDAEIRSMVAAVGSGQLITVGPDGYPMATLLPIVWTGGTVVCHMARANPHWTEIADGAPVLLVVAGAQAYISPSWYAAKAEHGRVVPTWNYAAVELAGRVTVHDDADWVRSAVDELTQVHEGGRESPWHTTDAPERYLAGQLRAIVGLEITVERVTGKAKYSQNRSEADRRGVVEGLRREPAAGADAIARVMETALDGAPRPV